MKQFFNNSSVKGFLIDAFLLVLVFLGIPHLFIAWNLILLLLIGVCLVFMLFVVGEIKTSNTEIKSKFRKEIIDKMEKAQRSKYNRIHKILLVSMFLGSMFFVNNGLVASLIILRLTINLFDESIIKWFSEKIDGTKDS